MAVAAAITFFASNRKLRILIHSSQGKDRSVAVGTACIVLPTELKHPLKFSAEVERVSHTRLYKFVGERRLIRGTARAMVVQAHPMTFFKLSPILADKGVSTSTL